MFDTVATMTTGEVYTEPPGMCDKTVDVKTETMYGPKEDGMSAHNGDELSSKVCVVKSK